MNIELRISMIGYKYVDTVKVADDATKDQIEIMAEQYATNLAIDKIGSNDSCEYTWKKLTERA